MLTHPTHERLIALGLAGMAKAFEEQRAAPDLTALSFEERVGIMADREAAERDTKRLTARLAGCEPPVSTRSTPCVLPPIRLAPSSC
ncbi:ATP-binding protein [Phenylobacterium sp.]|uniref:ATP-binding protein n=1 Tax=Phenylobacterium sp. TaxID=1871053 RepID=UPI00391A28DD